MKGSFASRGLLFGISAIATFNSKSVQAVSFGQQEVDQADFVAIARPYGNQQYDLLILQQLPGKRPCWQERSGTPTLINPLLLNFDFTGSCERSTDSNGYSIRLNGEDLGLTYLLRLIQRNGELVLVATDRRNPTQTEVVIGRTQGLSSGFMKIQLDPGWRFTKRTYAGKILSHVYLTSDGRTIFSDHPANPPNYPTPSPPHTNVINYPAPPAIQPPPIREFVFTAPNNPSTLKNSSIPSQGRNLNPPANSPRIAALPKSQTINPTWGTVPPTTPRVNANTLPTLTASNSNLLPPPPSSPKPIPTSGWGMTPTTRATVPAATTPLFSNPPARPSLLNSTPNLSSLPINNSQSYRVLAAVSDPVQQEQVKFIYPQAFSTNYNGQRLLQIGRFTSRENAEQASQSLQSIGLRGFIVP